MRRIAAAAGPRRRLGATRRALRDAHDPSARSQRLAKAPREALVTTTARVAPSRTAPMAGPLTEQLQMLRIDYDPALVPEGGAQVVGEFASPLSGEGRMTAEPAGRSFHAKILRKNGLLTGARARAPPTARRNRPAPRTAVLSDRSRARAAARRTAGAFVPRPSSHRADDHTSLPSPLPTALSQTPRSRRPRRAPRRSSTPPRTCPAPPPPSPLARSRTTPTRRRTTPTTRAPRTPSRSGPRVRSSTTTTTSWVSAASATWRPWTR